MKKFFYEVGCGIIIGIANIIPGVSGGTMALILGLYDKLIGGIRNISIKTLFLFLKSIFSKQHRADFKSEFATIEGSLLLNLAFGAIIAIFSLAKLMTYLLMSHHDPTYGFFFGLVLASVASPWSLIKEKTPSTFFALFIAIIAIIAINQTVSPQELIRKAEARHIAMQYNENRVNVDVPQKEFSKYAYYAFCGAIAISAMILPGISGSFVLLLMGGYFDILRALSTFDVLVLFSFALGCLIGLVAFVRLLHFLLHRYYNPTMGFLVGLVVGSLWVIWPFKDSVMVGTERVYLSNMVPQQFGENELFTLIAFFAGAIIVVGMLVAERVKRKSN
ncbi:MAG: DUF368 domain-containing protein [Spirochaetes bacterium]|nr:DUF368 domain-containing protein [Spirochaetota bacterium]